MTIKRTLLKLVCRHDPTLFVRNIYGDEIIMCGYQRSMWRCAKCNALVLKPELHQIQGRPGWVL